MGSGQISSFEKYDSPLNWFRLKQENFPYYDTHGSNSIEVFFTKKNSIEVLDRPKQESDIYGAKICKTHWGGSQTSDEYKPLGTYLLVT